MSPVRFRRRSAGRSAAALLLTAMASTAAIVVGAPAASAHPLGNATVNHYDGLQLYPDHITDTAIEDTAEIPTLQRKPLIDRNGDGRLSPDELSAYAVSQCASLAATNRISVNATRLALRVTSADYSERPGAIGLSAGRLVCQLTAPADLSSRATVEVDAQWDSAGIGWHEMTAVGHGVSLHDSPIPATSISDALQRYPDDLLSSPLDQRSARLSVTPGADASTYAAPSNRPTAGRATRLLSSLTTTFNSLVGTQHLTLGVGLLAVLLAMVLGAGHAFLPGHGKTIMAAYLVGKQGRYRDVAAIGATVTLTHTAGVLVIGLLLSVSATLAPTAVEQALAVVSGLIVAGVGLWLLIAAARRRPTPVLGQDLAAITAAKVPAPARPAQPAPDLPCARTLDQHRPAAGALQPARPALPGTRTATISAPQEHHPEHGQHGQHGHEHDHHSHDFDHDGQDHGHGHGHGHRHGLLGRHHHHHVPHSSSEAAGERPAHGFSRKGLVGLGVAGGLVPSPSALLVLLAAVALGRTAFGIVLVIGYGVGMATALTAAGLLLLRLQSQIGRIATTARLQRIQWLAAALPVLTAGLVLLVGVGLVLRALTGTV